MLIRSRSRGHRAISSTMLVGGLLAAGAALPAADEVATDYWVRAMPSLWFASLGGDFSYQDGGSPGTRLGADELGLGERQNSFSIEAGAQIPFLFGFHAGLSDFSTSAVSTLTRTVTFGGQTYTATDRVESRVALRDYYGEVCVRPINFDVAGFSIGIGVHGLDGQVRLTDQTNGTSQELSKTVPVPVVALRAHVAPLWALGVKSLTLEARVHYFDLSISGNHLRYADAEAQASWCPIDYLGIIAGYRYTRIDLSLDEPNGSSSAAEIDLHLSGPYVGVMAKY